MVERPAAGRHRRRQQGARRLLLVERVPAQRRRRGTCSTAACSAPRAARSRPRSQPNTQFNDLWMRFIASLAEYDRQQRVSDIVSGQRTSALSLTAEAVRQSGRNLAANASLYGWGGTQFAATAARQAGRDVVRHPEQQGDPGGLRRRRSVQGDRARRHRADGRAAPNIVKYRALAEAGRNDPQPDREVLERSGRGPASRSSTTRQHDADARTGSTRSLAELRRQATPQRGRGPPAESAAGPSPGATRSGDLRHLATGDQRRVPPPGRQRHRRAGHQGRQVSQLSQPSETQYAPSIPTSLRRYRRRTGSRDRPAQADGLAGPGARHRHAEEPRHGPALADGEEVRTMQITPLRRSRRSMLFAPGEHVARHRQPARGGRRAGSSTRRCHSSAGHPALPPEARAGRAALLASTRAGTSRFGLEPGGPLATADYRIAEGTDGGRRPRPPVTWARRPSRGSGPLRGGPRLRATAPRAGGPRSAPRSTTAACMRRRSRTSGADADGLAARAALPGRADRDGAPAGPAAGVQHGPRRPHDRAASSSRSR